MNCTCYLEVTTSMACIAQALQKISTLVQKICSHAYTRTLLVNNDVQALVKLLDSEAHRVYESAAYKTAMDYQKATGKEVLKEWNTQGDLKVRDTHEYIDSIKKKLNEPFITFDLDEAQFPGGFQTAENNVNCRCWLSYTTSS